jgi:GT2 family glycosyltransferase
MTSTKKCIVVVPVWNQWLMTETFAASWEKSGTGAEAGLVFVDNGSTDETAKRLRPLAKGLNAHVLRNEKNLGVAPAWNQGVRWALAQGADWIGILNNDLVLSPGWLSALISRAETRDWSYASPATREGDLEYDIEKYAAGFVRRCRDWDDESLWFGWCFIVRREVFGKVGFFDEGYRYGVGEDEDFIRRLKAAGFTAGVTGCSFVHHFSMQSQKALKAQIGNGYEKENLERLRSRWGHPRRRTIISKLKDFMSRNSHRLRYGHLLKE